MDSEQKRLESFRNWPPGCPVKPEDLAAAGQYYTGEKDETKCYVCKGALQNWLQGDDPYEEHKQHYPKCSLSKQSRVPHKKPKIGKQSTFADRAPTKLDPLAAGLAVGAGPSRGIDDLDLSRLGDREFTFESWKGEGNIWSQNMSLAGFYHVGPGDRVKCFKCTVGLAEWENTDVVFKEHMRESPKCPYVADILQLLKERSGPPHTELPKKTDEPIYLPDQPPSGAPVEEMQPLPCSLEGDPLCIVCKSRDRQVLFEPCNHFIVCQQCSRNIDQCPQCKRPILRKTVYSIKYPNVAI